LRGGKSGRGKGGGRKRAPHADPFSSITIPFLPPNEKKQKGKKRVTTKGRAQRGTKEKVFAELLNFSFSGQRKKKMKTGKRKKEKRKKLPSIRSSSSLSLVGKRGLALHKGIEAPLPFSSPFS